MLLHWVTLFVTVVVLGFVGVAYVRTRMPRLLVFLFFDVLLGLNMLATIGDNVLDNGVPYSDLLRSFLGLAIAGLLLATIALRIRWQP